jgi:hypothetical protein
MDAAVVPLQLLSDLGVPGLLSTLIVVIVALLVARVLLKVAVKIAIVAAIVVGVLWLFGLLPLLPF